MYVVYILRSLKDGRLYTGSTGNLHRRLREHNAGLVASTRHRRPLEIVYTEEFPTKAEAQDRERFFKTPAGGALKQTLVKEHEKRS